MPASDDNLDPEVVKRLVVAVDKALADEREWLDADPRYSDVTSRHEDAALLQIVERRPALPIHVAKSCGACPLQKAGYCWHPSRSRSWTAYVYNQDDPSRFESEIHPRCPLKDSPFFLRRAP